MKSIKYLLMSVLAAGALFTACSEDKTYDAAGPETGVGIGFPVDFATSIKIGTESSVEIPVMRSASDEALTIALKSDAPDIFTIPASASFAAGEALTSIEITFDNEDLEYDETYELEIAIDDAQNLSTYKASAITLEITRPAPWETLGMATLYENILFYEPYKVELQQSSIDKKQFRLVEPYTEGINNPDEEYDPIGEPSEYLEFRILTKGSTLGSQEITEDNLVYFSPANTGWLYQGYADVWAYHPANAGLPIGKNKVLEYQENGLPATVQLAPYYYIPALPGGSNYTGYDGVVLIVFPGVVLSDYSVELELTGYYSTLDGENFGVVDFTLGEDVEYALAASAPGNDPDSLLAAILDGSAETVELKASGTANLPVADGKNTVVVVTFGDGEPQEYEYITFNFFAGEDTRTPLEKSWEFGDLYQISDKEELFKTWNVYAVDKYLDGTDREFFGEWTFSENTEDDYEDEYETIDAINIQGLSLGYSGDDDTQVWEYYEGFIYPINAGGYLGESLYADNLYWFVHDSISDELYDAYDANYGMIGAYVDEGYIAFVNCAEEYGYDFSSIFLGGADPEDETLFYLYEWYGDIMLEDPALAGDEGDVAEARAARRTTASKELRRFAKNMAAPKNYVEKRGRERARAIIDEIRADRKAAQSGKFEITATSNLRKGGMNPIQSMPVRARL